MRQSRSSDGKEYTPKHRTESTKFLRANFLSVLFALFQGAKEKSGCFRNFCVNLLSRLKEQINEQSSHCFNAFSFVTVVLITLVAGKVYQASENAENSNGSIGKRQFCAVSTDDTATMNFAVSWTRFAAHRAAIKIDALLRDQGTGDTHDEQISQLKEHRAEMRSDLGGGRVFFGIAGEF